MLKVASAADASCRGSRFDLYMGFVDSERNLEPSLQLVAAPSNVNHFLRDGHAFHLCLPALSHQDLGLQSNLVVVVKTPLRQVPSACFSQMGSLNL